MMNAGSIAYSAAALLLVGVAAVAQQPADFTVTYESSNGTVAPQYYEVRRITIRSTGDSDIVVTKGTSTTGRTERKATFTPDAAKLKLLTDYVHSKHLDSAPSAAQGAPPQPRPGDGSCRLSFAVAANTYSVPCNGPDVSPLLEMIRNIVPSS